MQFLGALNICLIFFYNEINVGQTSGQNPEQSIDFWGFIRRTTTQTPSTTTQTRTIDVQAEIREMLDRLKQRDSNCTLQKKLIQEIEEGTVERDSITNYLEFFGVEREQVEKEQLIAAVPEGVFFVPRCVLNDNSRFALLTSISNYFLESCDDANTEGMD
uniref:Uncharacterized protein n=1 Tax=Onchocerca volvulus TaxID=6282 RepID=A0A8R1XS22_ONCVO